MGDLLARPRHVDPPQVRTIRQMLAESLEPLAVEHCDFGSGIGQAVLQLRSSPPGVERRGDGAQRHDGIEGHGPLGQIAHDDRHPVALLDPVGGQGLRKGRHGAAEGLIGHPLVLVDQEGAAGMGEAGLEGGAERGRSVLPGARG